MKTNQAVVYNSRLASFARDLQEALEKGGMCVSAISHSEEGWIVIVQTPETDKSQASFRFMSPV